MYKFVCISLKSSQLVTHQERKKYIKSFYNDCYNKKFGMIEKFVKAVGFNNILDDYVTDYPTVNLAKVKSSEEYTDPCTLLSNGMHIDLDKYGIIKFVIPMGKEVHPNSEFSYSHKKLCEKFYNFLKKVYPHLNITYTLLENYRPILRTFALDYFYQNMSESDIHYTVEFSSHRMLNEEEKEYIYNVLREWVKYPFHINQYYCETCKSYHKDSPYHIEIEYD